MVEKVLLGVLGVAPPLSHATVLTFNEADISTWDLKYGVGPISTYDVSGPYFEFDTLLNSTNTQSFIGKYVPETNFTAFTDFGLSIRNVNELQYRYSLWF